ncbi:MAG: hypothetical protein R2911_18320 [Caldilineaceae bacterium]
MATTMPSSSMGATTPARRTTTGSDAAQQSIAAAMQALENLNRQEIGVLQQIIDSLAAADGANDSSGETLGAQSIGIQSTGDTAMRGMEAAKQVQNLGFVEFTAGLINGTFDAVVGATLKQMEGYAKLVADLSKSIQQFQAENISDAHVTDYLAGRYPDGEGGTAVRPGFTFPDIPEDAETGAAGKTGNQQLQDAVDALINETQRLGKELRLSRTVLSIAQDDASITQLSKEQVITIRKSIGGLLATNMVGQLREMAREGMARIVVTDGEIMTKLTFNITTNELQERKKENYNRNLNRTQVGGGIKTPLWHFGASTDNTNLNINSINESSFDSTTMSTEMIGQVRIRFKTESFPSFVPSATPTDPQAAPDGE